MGNFTEKFPEIWGQIRGKIRWGLAVLQAPERSTGGDLPLNDVQSTFSVNILSNLSTQQYELQTSIITLDYRVVVVVNKYLSRMLSE